MSDVLTANSARVFNTVLQSAAAVNGNGTAMDVGGLNCVAAQVSGTFSATVNWEASTDGINYDDVNAVEAGSLVTSTTATTTGLYLIPVGGYTSLRARVSGYASGQVGVVAKGIEGPGGLLQTVTTPTQMGTIVNVTPVCDTSAYTAADVLFDTTAIPLAVRTSGGLAKLDSVTILDEDDNTAAGITLVFLRSNVSLGTINGAVTITDANAREIQGFVTVASGDFVDLIASKAATVKNVGLLLQPTTGTTLYVAAICAGTPTQTASGIKLCLGFAWTN